MQQPEAAEEVLKKTDITGTGPTYSWDLCIKYYAKQGDIAECERIYQLVCPLAQNAVNCR